MAVFSMKLGKKPKAPKMTASKSAWDSYEKRKKEYDQQKAFIAKEKDRRSKIKSR